MQNDIAEALSAAVEKSRGLQSGRLATYIPELACVNPEHISASICTPSGQCIHVGEEISFTLQSVSKLIPLIGLIEEVGQDQLNAWTNLEPSGQAFTALSQTDDRFGAVPSNPMVNAGAIALCSRISGDEAARLKWLSKWAERLFGQALTIDENVFKSEHKTGLRNRSIAYLLKSSGLLPLEVESVLTTYHQLCSFLVTTQVAAYLPLLLAAGGVAPTGERILSQKTCNTVISVMATCGLYDESGTFLVNTGMPAKSGVSGVLIAVALGKAGISVYSPRLNPKGGSVRGHAILQTLSESLGWHFAQAPQSD